MMKARTLKQLLILFITITSTALHAGNGRTYKFWVELEDKKGSTYSILRPWDFLRQNDISRREKAGSGITIEDLPVVSNYVQMVQETGAKVLLTSRWMNAVLVSTQDSSLANTIKGLYCVKNVSLMGIWNRKRNMASDAPDAVEEMQGFDIDEPSRISVGNKVKAEDYNFGYGLGWKQISMINGQQLHNAGYRGDGIYIAVLDAGFYRANRMAAFDSMFQNGRY